jgi:opacity protein-like surface antigen
MKRHLVVGLLVLGVCGQANAGSAETPEPSALDVSRPAFFSPPPGATMEVRRTPRRTYRRYERTDWRERERNPQGWLSIRGGGFDTEGVSKDDWTIGLKAVGKVAPTVRLGGSIDLMRRTNSDRTIVTEYVDASGNTVRSEVTTSEAESNLVPLMAVAEVVFPSPGIQPYVGIAGGWEFLNVQATDFQSGIEYEADYDGPGWQLFGGAAFAVAPRFQLSAEVFHNESTVERRVVDPFAGAAYDERVDVDGTGARVGLNFAF